MINHEQIQQMIECYGADIARWPCEDKKVVASFIENDATLSAELAIARQLDQSISESLAIAEPKWSVIGEKQLTEKILRKLNKSKASQNESMRWNQLVEWAKCLIVTPVIPAGIAALVLLLFMIQADFQNEQPHNNSDSYYSVAELDEWLIFEGFASSYDSLAGLDIDELTDFENEESGFESEIIFFL